MKLSPDMPRMMFGQRLFDATKDYQRVCRLQGQSRRRETDAELLATKTAIIRRLYEASVDAIEALGLGD